MSDNTAEVQQLGLVIKQQLNILETVTKTEHRNKYNIFWSSGQQFGYAHENQDKSFDDAAGRFFLGHSWCRTFQMNFFNQKN
ncbi:MAG: hypothetical protein OXC40_06475, partial [Proteobacteria bacterium]|nr:hypothetical protein [Pseudomonadota bacterium]